MILVDTNIWGRIADKSDVQHDLAMNAMRWTIRNGPPAIAAQSIYEFWVVATRPLDRNGLGWQTTRAATWIRACRRTCQFIPDDPRLFEVWENLVTTFKAQGKPAHDARLVACMKIHGINDILTFNISDFGRYSVNVIDPAKLPSS